ncbi:glycosyltransferase [Methylobacterium sp. A52T]
MVKHMFKYQVVAKTLDALKGRRLRNITSKNRGAHAPPHESQSSMRLRLSVVMPVYRTPPKLLTQAIKSILNQSYLPHEIVIVDDSGRKGTARKVIASLPDPNNVIKLIVNARNVGISDATNAGVQAATGDFILFVDHDDELTSNALSCFADEIEKKPDFDVWYSDQCTIDEQGAMKHHFLKPTWSPVYALGVMYVGHLLAVRSELCKTVLFRNEYDGVQDFDFLLRVSEKTDRIGHVPNILYKWRAIEGSLARKGDEKQGINALQEAVVNDHLRRTNKTWIAESHPTLPHRVVLLPSRATAEPRISIIIPSKNQGEIVGRCLDSIFTMTDYDNYEVILVDNRTTDPVALGFFEDYRVKRIRYSDKRFNYSAANNLGALAASGKFVLFLNNDTEIIESDWLKKLVMFFEDEDIGAVGATLLYPNRTVQHAGVILGPRGTADHVMRSFPEDVDGYNGSLPVAREVSAVTAACLMLPKELFSDIGGFSTDFAKHYQDVDLCLKIRDKGNRILSVGNSRVIHHESITRKNNGYDLGDRAILIDRWWGEIAGGDPYYNHGFQAGSTDYSLAPME